MSATILERDMLKTAVPERDMSVTTAGCGRGTRLLWLHVWQGQTTPGGLGEAHEHIVEQVQRGEIPAQAQDEEAEQHERWAQEEQGAGAGHGL